MRITILGATGRTGRHLVEQGLNDGHHIIAFGRNPHRLEVDHPQLTTVAGTIENHSRGAEAVRNADCLIGAIGLTKTSNKDVLRLTAQNVTRAMEEHGVRRLVSLIGAGGANPQNIVRLP
jgi:putative NADH-flavin reductase